MPSDPNKIKQRVELLLGTTSMAPLIKNLDRRFGKRSNLEGSTTLSGAASETIEAVTALLGQPPKSGSRLTIRIANLDEAIVNATGVGLIEALTILLGRAPQHPAEQRRQTRSQWQRESLALETRLTDRGEIRDDVIGLLVDRYRSTALQRHVEGDLERATAECLRLHDCLIGLPLSTPTSLAVFATERLGDSHALDRGQLIRRWLADAIKAIDPADDGAIEPLVAPLRTTLNEAAIRDRFDRVGIVVDELSSSVLILNLVPDGQDYLAEQLRLAASVGEPLRITFRMLRRWPLRFPLAHDMVSVCENPSVLAEAANRFGQDCRPIICIEGFPSHAATLFCERLRRSGIAMRYHGDFDASGLLIASQMILGLGMQPWRMSASDYLAAWGKSQLQLAADASLPATPWSETLSATMRNCGKSLLEETVLETLLEDLLDARSE